MLRPAFFDNFPFDSGHQKLLDADPQLLLPFLLEADARSGLLVQRLDARVRSALQTYYERGGYASIPLGEGAYASHQGHEIMAVLLEAVAASGKRPQDTSFLEIGASYGYLLHLLMTNGAKRVLGIEPGEEGVVGSAKYGVPMLREFFPTKTQIGRFDVVLSHGVLEHIEDLAPFVLEMRNVLPEGGMVFAAVPDCAEKLMVGDISILTHQHINYFTADTLQAVLTEAGFSDVTVHRSKARSILYAWGIKTGTLPPQDAMRTASTESPDGLLAIFEKNLVAIQAIVDEIERQGKTVGLYGSSGVLRGLLTSVNEPRMFDSDLVKHGTRIGGSSCVIEPPERLLEDPVDALLICPIDYDQEIAGALRAMGVDERRTHIVSLKNLYEKNSGVSYRVGSIPLRV